MSSDLAKVRAEQTKLMPETVIVKRCSRTYDSAGSWTENWQTAATTIGRIAYTGEKPDVREVGEMISTAKIYDVTLPYNTDVRVDDEVEINGKRYSVMAVLYRSYETAKRLKVMEVT